MKAACRVVFACYLVMVTVWAREAVAGEANAISLFDRNSLTGWDYGEQPVKGWRMVDGVLQGDKDSTLLLSGWSWGDVELSFRWRVSEGAQWRVTLRELPGAEAVADVTLDEEAAPSGRMVRATKRRGGPGKLAITAAATNDGWHTATLNRIGQKLGTSTMGGGNVSLGISEARFVVELALVGGSGALADLKAVEPAGEPLYYGMDLTGWWTPGNLESWKAEGDEIVCVNNNGNYLRTEKEYGNFTLSLEYKMAKGGNSGVGIRTARSGWPSGDGMELQMLDEPDGAPITRHSTMAIYGNLEPLARADRSQDWNRVVVKAEGYMISAWMNGVLVQHGNTAELPELRRRTLKGWIGLQDHGARTEFRNLQVLEMPDGLGLKAWQTPRRQSGSQLVLERLMNPEHLAIDDGLGSGAVETSVKGKDKQVLAELIGPAAVAIISRTNQTGRLAFYFDGESTPRLECAADKLHEHLPLVGQDTQPLLTYLPTRKSLKVTIRDARPVDYRFDYVTFPEGVPLEVFAEGQSCVARGLLPALSYRNEQLGWGTHREADPLPRAGSEGQKIDEQSEATLVDLEGPGIVEWTKLIAAPSLLNDDNLWLEVTVDEELTPSIAAPARYFFPGLANGNYPNYVVLNRNGWTNMLAMPFSKRLTVVMANHGRRPVNPVGMLVSYQPLKDANDPRLARRLRGVFLSESDSSSERSWAKQSGGGRFVGLVTQYGKAAAGVESLVIDGQPRDGWHSPDWRTLMGIEPKTGDERHSLSGRQGGFQWRFFLLTPPEFSDSFDLRASGGPALGDRLALFYMNAN
jgi:hypothetical protein